MVLLSIVAGGVFFVVAPYKANRLRADFLGWLHARGEAPLVLATGAKDGAYYAIGDVLRQHLDAYRSYKLELQPTGGSLENLTLLHEGQADLALIQGGLTTDRTDVVSLANLGRQYVHLAVPADSSIESFRDLAGKRVGVGPAGGGSEALAEQVLDFFNFSEDTTLVRDHNPNLREAFLDGEIDAVFQVYALFAPSMERLLGEGWYRLVPVADAEAVSRYLPGVFAEVLPPGLYGPDRSIPPAGASFHTLSVNTLLVARRALPERQVYTVLELIFSGDFLKAARLVGLDEELARTALHLPPHPAAEAFYNRNDPISADRFEILSFFLAGLVCLASVVHFLLGRRRGQHQARKRRAIRPYFEAMMDYGDEIEGSGNPAHLTRLIHQVMATQRGAEREWLEGRFDTEDMENLYAVYSLRCNNAFNKIFDLHLQAMRGINTVEPARDLPEAAPPARGVERDYPFQTAREVERDDPFPSTREVERPYPPPAPDPEPTQYDEDGYFSGSALAGIDTTKSELAERLPGRYDPALLYDTEASGAGSVRIRQSKPQADLQAAVADKDVPIRGMPSPADAGDTGSRPREADSDGASAAGESPGESSGDDEDDGPDQLLLC